LEPLGLVHDAHPDFFDAAAYLGFTSVRLGSFAAALDALQRANKLKSDQAVILFAIGTCLGKLRKTKQALANHERAVSLEPTSPELFVNLGLYFFEQADFESAKAQFQQVLQLQPDRGQQSATGKTGKCRSDWSCMTVFDMVSILPAHQGLQTSRPVCVGRR
jgi:tetratricopeptide (TPR) repeat protein